MDIKTAITIMAIKLAKEISGDHYDESVALEVADAVNEVTSDPSEIETLLKIAKWESGYRRNVANCKVKGDNGDAMGIWQVHPRSKSEAVSLCSSIAESAKIALYRVRESKSACMKKGMKGPALLSGYTIGHCVKVDKHSIMRWGDGQFIIKLLKEDELAI